MTNTYTKPSDAELRERLTAEQYQVTQHEATEPPFRNEFWDNKKPGLWRAGRGPDVRDLARRRA